MQIPLDSVEKMWQELEVFEMGLNKITAKKLMGNLYPTHMKARSILNQLVVHAAPLYAQNSIEMFLHSLPRFKLSDRGLIGKLKAYLK